MEIRVKYVSPDTDMLCEFKVQHNLKNEDIARICFVSRRTAQLWVQGKKNCPPIAWWKLHYDVLGQDIDLCIKE